MRLHDGDVGVRRRLHGGGFEALVGERDKYELLRELLGELGFADARVEFDEAGAPLVAVDGTAVAGLWVSVSDCGGLGAAVVSHMGPVGIDVQGGELDSDGALPRAGRARPRVVKRFFSDGERELPFALVWARKEAYAKCAGTGLTHENLIIDSCGLDDFFEYDLSEMGWPGYYVVIFTTV